MSRTRLSKHEDNIDECETIRNVLKYCSYDTTLVFDLDNTILRPTHEEDLGSDQWFRKIYQHAFSVFNHKPRALKSAIVLNDNIQKHIKIKPVEQSTPHIIHLLQDLNLETIAVTARGYSLSAITFKQLKAIDVSFSKEAIPPVTFEIGGKKIYYENNILFCDGANKGLCMAELIRLKLLHLVRAVMVDDVKQNLLDVASALRTLDIDFYGLRYSHLDDRVTRFELPRANHKLSEISLFFSKSVVNIIEDMQLDGFAMEVVEDQKSESKPSFHS